MNHTTEHHSASGARQLAVMAGLITRELRRYDALLGDVRGLQRFRQARQLYAASFVCARATAEAIRAAGAAEVCFVITGEWIDRDGDEDIACADYIESLLSGDPVTPDDFARRIRESDFGRRFTAGTWPNLPLADLDLAAHADLYDFAMPVRCEGEHLVIR